MLICKKCGTQIEDGIKYCPNCGELAVAETANAQPEEKKNEFMSKVSELNNTQDTTSEYDAGDIARNRVFAILAYFGPLVFIPMFAVKGSKYARFHANQGLTLLIAYGAYGIAYAILAVIIAMISSKLTFILTLFSLVGVLFTVLSVIGVINAASGKAKELPIIGKFKLLK